MMEQKIKLVDETTICSSFKILFIFLLKLEIVASTRNRNTPNNTSNHSCYTCIEPLVGYSKSYNSNITDSWNRQSYIIYNYLSFF